MVMAFVTESTLRFIMSPLTGIGTLSSGQRPRCPAKLFHLLHICTEACAP